MNALKESLVDQNCKKKCQNLQKRQFLSEKVSYLTKKSHKIHTNAPKKSLKYGLR